MAASQALREAINRANAQLLDYGYTVGADGRFYKNGTPTSVWLEYKRGRFYAVGGENRTKLWSGPDVAWFVQKFWYATKIPVGPARPGQRFTHGDVEISTELVDMYPAKPRGVRGLGCGCSDTAPQLRGVSLTYGALPNFSAFQDAFDNVARGDYIMELNHTDWLIVQPHLAATGAGVRVVGQAPVAASRSRDKVKLAFDARGLYKLLRSIVAEYDGDQDYDGIDEQIRAELGVFASGILSTLGFEWV